MAKSNIVWAVGTTTKAGKIKDIFAFSVSNTKQAAIDKVVEHFNALESKFPNNTWRGLKNAGYCSIKLHPSISK